MAFLELCKSGKFSQCSSINFGQYYNFPKNATQISLSMRQSFQADELFIERFVCLFYWNGRSGRRVNRQSNTYLLLVVFMGAAGLCVHIHFQVCVISHFLFWSSKANE